LHLDVVLDLAGFVGVGLGNWDLWVVHFPDWFVFNFRGGFLTL